MNTTRKSHRVIVFLLAVVMVSFSSTAAAQNSGDVEIKASISAEKIGLDDVLTYTLTFKGINNPNQPNLSGLTGFSVESTSRSTEFRFVNGVSSYYTNFIYYLNPLQEGTFKLPPVTYSYQGRDYSTRSFQVQVVKGSVAPHRGQTGRRRMPSIFDDEDFFSSPFSRQRKEPIDVRLLPQVSKSSVVKGEQVILKIMLYTRNRIRAVNMAPDQSIPGFWMEWFPVSNSIQGETRSYNDKVYQVYEVRKVALFPNKSGKLKVPPLKFDLGLAGDTLSFFTTNQRLERASKEMTIDVRELPPAASNLPVGSFNFKANALKNNIDINDILTIKLTVSGSGNIKTLVPPTLEDSAYIKVYPAKISRDVSFKGEGVSGSVEAEIPVSFKKSGLISLPALTFKYYDPAQDKVIAAASKPLNINVTGAKEKQARVESIASTEIIKQGEDIDFIKKGAVSHQGNLLHESNFFILLLLLPFVLNLLIFLKVFVFDRFISGSALVKKRKLLNHTVKELENVKEPGQISPILENYLKEKSGLGLSAINNQSIDQLLTQYNTADADIKTFIRLKNESDSFRFSPDKNTGNSGWAAKQLKHDLKVLVDILKRIDNRIK